MQSIGRLLVVSTLLLTTAAHAVGLGKMRVLSALDEPLNAEIEVLSATAAELNTLRAGLASRSDFTRAGVERSAVLSIFEFETLSRDNGDSFIRVSTQEPVSEPFLHFLVALDWAGGRLIREYTALLDPPLYAQGRPASVSSPRLAGRTAGSPITAVPAPGTAAQGVSAITPRPTAPRAPGELFGPVGRGETLSDIVARMNLPADVDVFQAMFALLRKNPDAFILGNINLIKEGSTISLPDAAEMRGISKVIASREYSEHLNEWLAYRGRVASQRLAGASGTTPLPSTTPAVAEPLTDAGSATAGDGSGLSQDVLRIIQSGEDGAIGESGGGEVGTLRSQLATMEESLLSTELENKELRERLSILEEQIKETNRLLAVNDAGLALAERQAAQPTPAPAPQTGELEQPEAAPQDQPSQDGGPVRVTSTGGSSLLKPVTDLLQGDMLWRVLLALAAVVLLVGIVVYVRRRQSYAEFEETMMTGSTYDLRSNTTAYTQMPRMDSVQAHSQPSRVGADSQQSGSLMQTSFMTEMGAPGMGAMQADEVDPIAEAEVYMAYGRDQQAMEVLQDAIRRDPSRLELKLKLLEVYQKRKDVRAFESLAEELHGVIGKDPARWSRVTEMGRRVSPRHPLFAVTGGAALSTEGTATRDGSLDMDSSGLDLVSAPFSRSGTGGVGATDVQPPSGLDLPSTGLSLGAGRGRDNVRPVDDFSLDADSVSIPAFEGLGSFSEPASAASGLGDTVQSISVDDFKDSEIATKLDLAKAYLEMGDRDAARGFIEEVLREGNDNQKKQASELAASF